MLEVKELRKEYKPKRGAAVNALDGVSIRFPEKGMVFILGKSGSGKSTLLNLLGGLDKPTSGEIIIKGKSSKDFKQSEFDSYRNTYLGFIFQEYNILKDFNVAQNIAIALQLQGRKATNEEINEILQEVDLEGYGGRKPSELSGGQKQRVAIARALVKNPEIIMADEPTGALDSKTGLQVFDTLKKLSAKKLVIVITHDRDFAEMYGDRVIELKDGKVISDIEKYSAEAKVLSSGVSVTDETIITIKKGYVLTEEDVRLINEYLMKNDMMISVDDKANKDLRRFARINENGDKEGFKDTDEGKIKYSENSKFKLIKSRLPLKNMIKIGASSLKNKPIRLVFTILLSVVAFTMFGLTDTFASYNKITATEKSIESGNITAAVISAERYKVVEEGSYSYESLISDKMTAEDVAYLNQTLGIQAKPVLDADIAVTNYGNGTKNALLYQSGFGGFIEADAAYLNRLGFTVVGQLPKNTEEVAITSHYFAFFRENGYTNGELKLEKETIANEQSFLSKKPTISDGTNVYTITAIVDTKMDMEKYSALTEMEESTSITDYILYSEYNEDIQYGYHSALFVKEGFLQKKLEEDRNVRFEMYLYSDRLNVNAYAYLTKEQANAYEIVYTKEASERNNNGLVIDLLSALNLISSGINSTTAGNDETGTNLINTFYTYQAYYSLEQSLGKEAAEEYGVTEPTEEEVQTFLNQSKNYILGNTNYINEISNGYYSVGSWYQSGAAIQIEGFFIDPTFLKSSTVIVGDEIKNVIQEASEGKFDFAIYGNPTKEQWKKIVRFHYTNDDAGIRYALKNGAMSTIGLLNDIVEMLSNVFLYIGIGFAVFAALMLTNFISTSIVYKKREIGILRAVGARGSDVYGIFAIESVIIALINFALATIATGVICGVVGASFRNQYHLSISVLNFGIRQIALILGVAVVVALIASFLPTFRISRQKPVDAIKK